MIRLVLALLVAFACLMLVYSHATPLHHVRSHAVARAFERTHPCPSTGKTAGACPGYVKDHIVALCRGGADAVENLQWQTVAAAKAKDRWECKKA